MSRTTLSIQANSSSATTISIPANLSTAFEAVLVEAPAGGDLPQSLFVVTDSNYTSPAESFQVPAGRSYVFHAPAGTNWSPGAVIGTVQLGSQGDGWSTAQPAVTANFELFIDY